MTRWWRQGSATIQMKLSVVIVALVIGLVTLLAGIFTARFMRDLERGLMKKAETYGLLVARGVASAVAFNDRQTAREAFDAISVDDTVRGLAVYGANGRLIEARGDVPDFAAIHLPVKRLSLTRTPDGIEAIVPVTSVEGPRGSLVLVLTTEALAAGRRSAIFSAVGWGLAAVAVGLIAAWFIARSFARRIALLSRAATAVAGGELHQAVVVDSSGDEIGLLAQSFNSMWAKLRSLMDQIQLSARQEAGRLEGLVSARTAELDSRNAEMRLVLDNVEQGLITVDLQGGVAGERSRISDLWFGAPTAGQTFWDWAAAGDAELRRGIAIGWEMIADDVMPLTVTIDQLPKRLNTGPYSLELSYTPLFIGGVLDRFLVVITDVTARLRRDLAEQAQQEFAVVVERFYRDRAAVTDFFSEARSLVRDVCAPDDMVKAARALHTLKGNAGMLGLDTLAQLCGDAESGMTEACGSLDHGVAQSLLVRWQEEERRFACLVSDAAVRRVELDLDQYQDVLDAIAAARPHAAIGRLLEGCRYEPVVRRLDHLADQARWLGHRLEKDPIAIAVRGEDLRLPPGMLSTFWSTCVHVIRNAVDHGLESAAERREAGKADVAALTLTARLDGAIFEVEVRDSGRGIDWDAIRTSALRMAQPCSTQAELTDVLFSNGVTSRDVATEISGRGVGMGAVREACLVTGGSVSVISERGVGTRVSFRWPAAAVGVLSFASPVESIPDRGSHANLTPFL